jgi:hypothetical protein
MIKEFNYDLAEMGDFFSLSWSAKSLEFQKSHSKEVEEEIRLENLTKDNLKIDIDDHDIIKHPRSIVLKPEEVRNVTIVIPCKKITKKLNSFLTLKSKNQEEKIPIKIKHVK